MAVRMTSFPTLTAATCMIMSFMTLFSGVQIHGATATATLPPNVACIVGTNLFTASGTLFSAGAGSNGTTTGPYIYNASRIGYSGVSNIGSYNVTDTQTTTVIPGQPITFTNGAGNWTYINGTASDALYFSFTGVGFGSYFQLNGIITGGSGKYSGAVGTIFTNGTGNVRQVNNLLATAGNGTVATVATVLLP